MEQWRTPRGRKIYTFLRKDPKAAKVRAHDGDREWVVMVSTPKETCAATIGAERLEALNERDEVLRTIELDEDEQDVDRPVANQILAVDVPRLVDNIGRNMREMATAAAGQQSDAYKAGFKAMTDVINLCLEMLNRVDQRLENFESNQAPQVVELPEQSDGSDRNEMARMAIMQVLQQQQPQGAQVNPAQVDALTSLFRNFMAQQQGAPTEQNNHAG